MDHKDAYPYAAGSNDVLTDVAHGIEKFSAKELTELRATLLKADVDSFQAAQIVSTFLSGRGYGISTDEARLVAAKIEGPGCTVKCIGEALEQVARAA